ncbi:MAG: hypothetical protein GXO85_08495 [Chlorobi bacterium]|nr:hypothetical protein [Chlorobiota bacterium]
MLARYLRLTDLMLESGPDLGLPHTRAMGKNLFELRVMRNRRYCKNILLY